MSEEPKEPKSTAHETLSFPMLEVKLVSKFIWDSIIQISNLFRKPQISSLEALGENAIKLISTSTNQTTINAFYEKADALKEAAIIDFQCGRDEECIKRILASNHFVNSALDLAKKANITFEGTQKLYLLLKDIHFMLGVSLYEIAKNLDDADPEKLVKLEKSYDYLQESKEAKISSTTLEQEFSLSKHEEKMLYVVNEIAICRRYMYEKAINSNTKNALKLGLNHLKEEREALNRLPENLIEHISKDKNFVNYALNLYHSQVIDNAQKTADLYIKLANISIKNKDWVIATEHILNAEKFNSLPSTDDISKIRKKYRKDKNFSEFSKNSTYHLRTRESYSNNIAGLYKQIPAFLLGCVKNKLSLVKKHYFKNTSLAVPGLQLACSLGNNEIIAYYLGNHPNIIATVRIHPEFDQAIKRVEISLEEEKRIKQEEKPRDHSPPKSENIKALQSTTQHENDPLKLLESKFKEIRDLVKSRKVTGRINAHLNERIQEQEKYIQAFEYTQKNSTLPTTTKLTELIKIYKNITKIDKTINLLLLRRDIEEENQESAPTTTSEETKLSQTSAQPTPTTTEIDKEVKRIVSPPEPPVSPDNKRTSEIKLPKFSPKLSDVFENPYTTPRLKTGSAPTSITLADYLNLEHRSQQMHLELCKLCSYSDIDWQDSSGKAADQIKMAQLCQSFAMCFQMIKYLDILKTMPYGQNKSMITDIRNILVHAQWLLLKATGTAAEIAHLRQQLIDASRLLQNCHIKQNYAVLLKNKFFASVLPLPKKSREEKEGKIAQPQRNQYTQLTNMLTNEFNKIGQAHNCEDMVEAALDMTQSLTQIYGHSNPMTRLTITTKRHPGSQSPWSPENSSSSPSSLVDSKQSPKQDRKLTAPTRMHSVFPSLSSAHVESTSEDTEHGSKESVQNAIQKYMEGEIESSDVEAYITEDPNAFVEYGADLIASYQRMEIKSHNGRQLRQSISAMLTMARQLASSEATEEEPDVRNGLFDSM